MKSSLAEFGHEFAELAPSGELPGTRLSTGGPISGLMTFHEERRTEPTTDRRVEAGMTLRHEFLARSRSLDHYRRLDSDRDHSNLSIDRVSTHPHSRYRGAPPARLEVVARPERNGPSPSRGPAARGVGRRSRRSARRLRGSSSTPAASGPSNQASRTSPRSRP
jgi:hypothetical protein